MTIRKLAKDHDLRINDPSLVHDLAIAKSLYIAPSLRLLFNHDVDGQPTATTATSRFICTALEFIK